MAQTARIAVAGLGTMGAALALNIADRGFPVAVWNRSPGKVDALLDRAGPLAARLRPAETWGALAAGLARPRAVILMLPAGAPAQAAIDALAPHLEPGDIVIDAGNADFNDSRARARDLAARGLRFLGIGVSGGEAGARHGPSIMVGGDPEAWAAVRDILEAIAARYRGAPCAALLGPEGAGHFVKTVHNGIEYADMELIAETYGILRHGLGRAPDEIADLFARWNAGPLAGYLVEITAEILATEDPATGGPVVDAIRDVAGQKGTGRWTLIEALKLGRSPSVIEAGVAARAWSAEAAIRALGAERLEIADGPAPDLAPEELEAALLTARLVAYGQGMALLGAASAEHGWQTDLARVAEIWRAGCIIRCALLDDVAGALRAGPPEGALHLAPGIAPRLAAGAPALRRVVAAAVAAGLPVPALAGAASYLETMRRGRGTTDLIQAQRDYFGAHGFERRDAEGRHHGPWHIR